MMKKFLAVMSLAGLMSSSVLADPHGWYMSADLSKNRLGGELGVTSGIGLGLGYDLNQYVDFELNIRGLGTFKRDTGYYSVEDSYSSSYLGVIGKYPINEAWGVFGRFAAGSVGYTSSIKQGKQTFSISESESKNMLGVGASYICSEKIKIRFEYMDYQSTTINTTSLGIVYDF
jgi:opacity protein-like surface antigen